MAKYAISQEGIDSLKTLAEKLIRITTAIDNANKTLYSYIDNIGDGLGTYQKDMLILLKKVISTNQNSKESVEQLAGISIPKQILSIEKLLILCGDNSSDDPDEPPQKKLTLGRRR